MALDMKEMIARAAGKLLMEGKTKKLTVKDIVSECHITRQAFYYHFADIPELLHWVLQQREADALRDYQALESMEERIRYWLLLAINAAPYVKRGIESNYGAELRQMLMQRMREILAMIAGEEPAFAKLAPFERDLALRYHYHAVTGLLQEWSDEDSEHLERIVHDIYLIASNQLLPEEKREDV